jgi:hypothetical protein
MVPTLRNVKSEIDMLEIFVPAKSRAGVLFFSDDKATLREAKMLGDKFDYSELMGRSSGR